MFGFGKSRATADGADGIDKPQPRSSWSFRKKLILIVLAAIVVVALAVGLGVGLTRGGGGDGGDDDHYQNDGDEDLPEKGPDRSSTWTPSVNASWQIVLRYPIDLSSAEDITPDVDIYDIDVFDNDLSTFSILRDAGKKIICYFSAGSWENWRADKDDWDEADLGKELDGWPDERWVNLTSPRVHDIMKTRIKYAWQKGCDAIDPDNVDGYQNDNGLGLTSQDSVDFMRFLSEEAAQYNMSIGLKNAGDIIEDVIDFTDFSVNEQCVEYSECETFAAFVEADKPVFHIEYPDGAPNDVSTRASDEICSHQGKSEGTEGFSTIIKTLDLDGWAEYCGGETFETKLLD